MKTNTLFQNLITVFSIFILFLNISCSKENLTNEVESQISTIDQSSGQRNPDIIIWLGIYDITTEDDGPLSCQIATGYCMIEVIGRTQAFPFDERELPAIVLFNADTVFQILPNKAVLDTVNFQGGYKVTLKNA
jgi:hypothetical protein